MKNKYKIIMLGTENSHAKTFMEILNNGYYKDIEVSGVFGDVYENNEQLLKMGAKRIGDTYDEFLDDDIDGVIITARHGDNHYKYALPYIEKGVSLFIDKPFTINEAHAIELIEKARKAGSVISGGSVLKENERVRCLKSVVENINNSNDNGEKVVGGDVAAPLIFLENTGGIYFYAPHLVEMVLEIFGKDIKSVLATEKDNTITAIFSYDDYDITAHFGSEKYSGIVYTNKDTYLQHIEISKSDFKKELDTFLDMMKSNVMKHSFIDMILPVFVLNALERSLTSGRRETINSLPQL